MRGNLSPARLTLVFVTVGAVTVAAAYGMLRDAERRSIRSHVDTVAAQAAARLSSFVRTRALLVDTVARERAAGLLPDDASFARQAEILRADLPGFRAINWIDADGVIRLVTPLETNEAALGRDVDEHPQAAPFIERARRSLRMAATDPIDLFQGGKGIALYFPVVGEGRLQGFVNAVFSFDVLVPQALAEGVLDDYEVRLTQGAVELFRSEGWARSTTNGVRGQAETEALGRRWQIEVAAKPSTLASLRWGGPEALLFGGSVLWLLMGGLLYQLLRRRQAHERLEADRRVLATLVERSPDAQLLAEAGRVTYGNAAADALLGGAVGREVGAVFGADGWEGTRRRLSKATSVTYEAHVNTDEGPVEVRVAASRVEADTVALSLTDLRPMRQMQAAVAHAQKLEALGQLAGSVAHDFNNLLAAIVAQVSLLQMREDLPAEAQGVLDEVTAAAMRGAELTRGLLMLTRREPVAPQALDLVAALAALRETLRQLVPKNIELLVELPDKLPRILFDRAQLEQVLLNLVVNAVHAMPDGGRLEISARSVDEGVMLVVRDDGVGMSEEVRARAFEPFFTTKDAGRGTGLGLSSVKACVETYGGRISLWSEEGRGTSFEIRFPIAPDARPRPTPLPVSTEVGLDARVLLVDDDDAVRRGLQRMLEGAGARCLAFATGAEALAATEGEHFDIAIVDMMMPEMSGAQLGRALRERGGLPIVILSGYSANADTSFADAVLTKPVRTSELVETLRRVLEARVKGAPSGDAVT